LIKNSIERAARARFAFPVVLGLALLAMAINEGTFQHTWRTLTHGIALTDARIEASKALQAITLMEAAARAVMAHDNTADRQRFDVAARDFEASRKNALQLIAKVDMEGVVGVDKLRRLSDEQVQRYRTWLDQTGPAQAGAAHGLSDDSRANIAELQAEFSSVLAKAAAVQQMARVSIYDALMLSRLAVHALVLLSALALFLFARELRRSDAARVLEHQRLAAQIKERTSHLRDLAEHLVSVREDERGRLARELHDEMGGLLTAIKLELARLRRVPGVPRAALDRVLSIDARLNDGIAFKRRIVENLRPSSLDQLGLKVALELLCTDSSSVMAIPVHASIGDINLGPDMDLTLYRIVQEALTNVAKYAAAHHVWVELVSVQGKATLTIRDDGRGFDPALVSAGRHGLLGMQVRVEGHEGSLQVHSRPGAGTRIVATLPKQTVPVLVSAATAAQPFPGPAYKTQQPTPARELVGGGGVIFQGHLEASDEMPCTAPERRSPIGRQRM
jgi:signal transduction histidine kinase